MGVGSVRVYDEGRGDVGSLGSVRGSSWISGSRRFSRGICEVVCNKGETRLYEIRTVNDRNNLLEVQDYFGTKYQNTEGDLANVTSPLSGLIV